MNRYVLTPLDALGDPTRRRVLELLRDGPRSVGEVAARVPVSRPAVSQHLAALRRAGLVTYAVEGRRHVYAIDRAALADARAWFDGFWDVALERYAAAAAAAATTDTAPVSPDAAPGEAAAPEPSAQTPKKPKKRGKRKKKSRKERR